MPMDSQATFDKVQAAAQTVIENEGAPLSAQPAKPARSAAPNLEEEPSLIILCID